MIFANLYHFFIISILLIKVLLFHQFFVRENSENTEVLVPINILYREFSFNKQFTSELEKVFTLLDLIDVQSLDSTIIVDLKYAGKNNFLGINFYGNIKKAYLNKDAAKKIVLASKLLKEKCIDCRLVILDAARPLTFQKKMWLDLNLPFNEKEKFVCSPEIYSLHNFGAAVDVTIKKNGKYLDMGSEFDEFTEKSFTIAESYLLSRGIISTEQYKNRLLLREIMIKAGFYPIETEWWHFNSCSRKYALNNYKLITSHLLRDYQKNKTMKPKSFSSDKIKFKIQIYSSMQKLTGKENIFKKEIVDYYYSDGLYRYTIGNYSTLKEAFKRLQLLREKGFTDAFIVAFYKDMRINIKDAIELLH